VRATCLIHFAGLNSIKSGVQIMNPLIV